jgi:hypothetical protein
MENSPLKFLDNDVSQMLNKEVKLKKEKQNRLFHIELYNNRSNNNINLENKDVIDDLFWRIRKYSYSDDEIINVKNYVFSLEDFMLENMNLIRLPCGIISDGAQCMCDVCLDFDDY